jgi:hypothetical protein
MFLLQKLTLLSISVRLMNVTAIELKLQVQRRGSLVDDILTRLRNKRLWDRKVDTRKGQEIFFVFKASSQTVGPTKLSVHRA